MKLTKIIVIITVLSLIFSTSWAQEKLSLSECIQIALKNNSQLKNAQRNVDIAKSGVKAAYSNILPRLDAQFMTGKTHQGEVEYFQDIPAEYEITQVNIPVLDPTLTQTIGFVPTAIIGQPTRYDQRLVTQPAYDRESNSFNLSLNQNIFDGGNWWNQIRKARSDKAASLYATTATRLQIILNVKQYYYNLLKQIELLNVYQESQHSYEEQYRRTQGMFEIGSIAQADVFKARVSLGEAQSQVIEQQNQVTFSRYNLNFMMGRDPKSPIEIMEVKLDSIPKLESEIQIERAMELNPEVQYYAADATSAEYAHKIAKSRFWPSVGVGANYSRFSPDLERIYQGYDKNYYWSVGASVSMNLFNGFGDQATAEIQKANYLNKQEDLVERKRRLRAEIQQAYLGLKANEELIAINKENLVSANEDLRLAQERYRVGSGTLLEVLQAQVSVTQANARVVSAKYDVMISQAQLQTALGTLKE